MISIIIEYKFILNTLHGIYFLRYLLMSRGASRTPPIVPECPSRTIGHTINVAVARS